MKQFYFLTVFVFVSLLSKVEAQVSLTATNGTLAGTYTTLKQAFDSINVGKHRGDITIEITASTTEGITPATLLSGDADPTSYSSIFIFPGADGVSISGNPGAGFGVIQLNGADNVIIDGDNPNTAGINRDLTISNTSLSTAGFTSCLRVATLAGASAFADNIFLFNCNFIGNVTAGNSSGITGAASSSNTSFGLYFGGKGAVATPTAITSETADAALAGTTINNVVIDNVSINQCGRGIVFNGAATTVSSSLSVTNSIIGAAGAISGYPVTSPNTTVYTKGIWVAGCESVLVNGNTIQNILSYVSTTAAGIEMAANIGSSLIITGNTLNGVLNNGAGGTANGILVSAVSNRFTIGTNIVSNIQGGLGAPVTGITIATAGGASDITKNRISGIYNRNSGGFGALGIHLSTAANDCQITNNFISDILNIGNASFTNTAENAAGILLGSGSSHKIYHNSVSMYGASAATGSNVITCLSVGSSAVASLDIRNNIFSNTVTLSGAPTNNAHVCMYFPFTSATASGYTINNNAYYTANVAGVSGVAFAGASTYNAANLFTAANFNPLSTLPATNFRNWSSAAGSSGNDFASFASTTAAPFVSATDLHIVAGPTQLESAGVATTVGDDIDGAGRGTFPDIGADEFAGTIQDLTPPTITYTPLDGTCVLGNRTLTANIIDPSGVPTAGIGLPVLYWRINAGAYAAVTATSLGGGNYSFTFGAGAIVGDNVSYYIVAQDNVATPNVLALPSTGAAGYSANPPAAATAPTAPESYSVQNNLAPGTYNVGGGQIYTTLTAAINAYNTSCLTGPVTFQLTDAVYSTSETFPIVIGNPVASAVNTLTIRPAAGINATITGSSAGSLIQFNGADYVTIDGSNNGTASQNLTIINTLSSTTTAVIWLASPSASNGATNNTIKNSIIIGSGTTNTYGGVVSSSSTTLGNAALAANSNNTYQNLIIHSVLRGIALVGVSTGDNNNTITQCRTGSTIVAEKIGLRGIVVFNQTNVNITNNTVQGITTTAGSNTDVPAGISIKGAIVNGVVASNVISDCKNTSTAGWVMHGITLQSTGSNTGLSVYNNFIHDIAAFGFDPNITDNGHGIGILSGGGYKIYYNSINLTTNQSEGNSAAIFIDNRTGAGVAPSNLDIRNNIFANSQTSFVRYSIYSSAPASAFTNINYNDYYTAGTTLGFLGAARATLADWQSASLADANSVSVIPQFVSATNLHLSGASTLNNLGTALAGFITDIDTDIRNATTPDIGADEFTPPNCGGVITGGTITASKTTLCVAEDVTFGATAGTFSFGTGMSYQWESSPNGLAPWTAVSGQTNPLTATITISTPAYYRLSDTCSFNAATGSSNIIQIFVNSPTVTGSTGGSVCGLGTVNLTATGSGGTTLRWYDVSTGGAPLSTGSPYTTPSISTTTTYYVEAVSGLTTSSVGPVSPAAQGGTIVTGFAGMANWSVFFEVIQTATLLSVDIFPEVSGQAGSIAVYNSAGTLLASQAYTTAVSGGATAQTITFAVPATLPVGTGYYIESIVQPNNMFTRNSSGSVYPYTSSAINITGTDLGPTSYAYYYNWQFSSGCASPRTAVIATVTAPPAFTTPTASPVAVCEGASSNLTSLDADYPTYSWAPTAGLSNPAIANPVATPSSTTTYTVTVTSGACATSADVTVTVNPTPTALSISPAGPIAFCAGGAAQLLTTSGGSGDLFRERFNAFPISKFTITGTGVTENSNTTYYQDAPSSVHLTHGNSISSVSPGSYEMTNNINLSLYSNSVLTFYHIAGLEDGFDYGFVEYTTDGGTNWTPFPVSSYTGTATLKNGVVSYDASSYGDWNAQMGTGANPGVGPAASMWKLETINLAPWQASTQFKVRFRIQSDGSVLFYGWLIDDVKINSQATVTWAPTTELFTNAAATISYTGTNASSVYTRPTSNQTYTATAAFGTCPATDNVVVNVTSNPISLSIVAAPSTTICQGDTVNFAVSARNIQGSLTPFYDWKLNGTTITGSATGGSSAGTTITVASTATLYPGMRVNVSAGVGGFPANTEIINILGPTTFTVSAVPAPALSGATVAATASGRFVDTFRYAGLANGDVVTCALDVFDVVCVPVRPVTSNAIPFTVTPGVATSVNIVVSPGSTVCAGENVTFTATPTNGGAAPTYEWFVNNVSQGLPSLTNTFVTSTLANSDVVTCRMKSNALNCPFPLAPFSNPVAMTVNASSPVSVVINSAPAPTGSTVSICNGTSVTFTATPTNGGGSPLYEWFVSGVSQGAPSGTATFVSSTLVDLDEVTVVLTSSIPTCALGNPNTSNILDISVTVQPASVTITPAAAICAGTSKTFTAIPVNGGVSPTYQWYVNSSPVGINADTYNYTPADGDVVEVEMTSSLSCALPIPATGTLTQFLNALPSAAITGNNTLCPNVPVLLTSNALAGSGSINTIQWRLGGSNIVGATSATYVATAIGNYDVVITNTNGCSFTSAIFTITAAAVALTGPYTIGEVNTTATGSSAGSTINVASTATLVPNQPVAVSSGTGAFAASIVTATAAAAGTTITVASTTGLQVGQLVMVATGGSGVFANGTTIATIVNATTFTVSTAPTTALAIGNVIVAVSRVLSITNGTQFVVSPAPVTALAAGATITAGTCTNYISFLTAIRDLNVRSISNNCTFDVAAGFRENLPAKMPALGNATLNLAASTRTIVFQKNGAGANPRIIAYTGGTGTPGAAIPDGIFTIAGTDNITIDAIDLEENPSNATNPSTMEYGYGLFKLAAGDGVQNATIRNCVITLNRINNAAGIGPMPEGSVGILQVNSIPTTATTALTPTNGGTVNTNGSNSNNKYYTNTIQNCNTGIALSGFAATAPAGAGPAPVATTFIGDLGNDVGGAALATGNTIVNYGGGGAVASAGIKATNQWSVNISYNDINSNNGSGVNHAGDLRGIFGQSGLSANATITNNTVSLKTAATAGVWTGIDNVIGSTAAANTVNINNNTIQNCSFSAASSPGFFGISNTSTAANVNINFNNISTIAISNTSLLAPVPTAINNTASGTTNCSISNNTISSLTNAAASGLLRGISTGSATNGTFNTNVIDGLSFTATVSTGSIDGIISTGNGLNNTFTGNIIRSLSIPSTGSINGIRENGSTSGTKTIQNNQIYNFSTTAGGAGGATFNGILANLGTTYVIAGNEIYALTSTGTTGGTAGVIAGIQTTGTTGITNTFAISKNRIYNISTNSTGPIVYGLLFAGPSSPPSFAQTITASNNFVADLKAPFANSADAIRGIAVTNPHNAGSTYNIYYNSISINASSTGATFGTSGIYHFANATATSASLNLRNNIVHNTSSRNGATGFTVAFRRSAAALNNYAATSNNNLYYAGTPSATNLIYFDGTNSDQDITSYKARVATRDAASVSDIVNFVSATDLHVTAPDNCALEGGAAVIVGFGDDIDAEARGTGAPNNPDIGADEFTGTGVSGVWAGVNTDWNNPVNWCGGVPTATTSVTIPTAPNYPVITGYTALSNNITITGSGTITVGAGGILRMAGNVTSAAGTINATAGTIELNSTAAQILRADHFVSATIDSLVIANTNVAGATIDNTGTMLFITSGVSFADNNNQKFNTSNLLTLRSTATKTARVADVTLNSTRTGNDVVGKVVMERFITARRAWRFLSAPIRSVTIPTPTIYSNWQEGARSFPLGTLADPFPGYGTHVSNGNNVPDFDQNNTNNPSIYYLTGTGWNGVPTNTSGTTIGANNGVITDQPGYMLFVRGNRATNLALGTNAAVSATTLRTTGNLNVTSSAATPLVATGAGGSVNGPNFNFVFGNPYPSAISFEQLRSDPLNATVPTTFYVWDANLTGTNGVGGWVTVNRFNATTYTTSTGSFPDGLEKGIIQSGMAFLMVYPSATPPTVRFKEAFKAGGSDNLVYRPARSSHIRTSLLAKNADGTRSVNDAILVYFDNESSNGLDANDAFKVQTFAENIAIVNNGVHFAIDRRKSVSESDTIFLSMFKMRSKQYALSLDLTGLGLCAEAKVAILEDRFLNTKTVLNMEGNTEYNFAVTLNTPSADSGRFRIIFKKMVQFAGIKAAVLNDDVAVDWNISTELNIDRYEIERSANGTSFETVGSQLSRGNTEQGAAYSVLDLYPPSGVNYYRIKATGKNGTVLYSDVAKVTIIKRNPAIFVFPNPVTNNVIGLQLTKMPEGLYEAVLMSADGKVISRDRFMHAGGTSTEKITPRNLLPGGNYRIEVMAPDKSRTVLNVIVQKQ